MDIFLTVHFLLGPLMLVLSFIYKRFPPKKINYIYGYRTPRSMRSIEAWHCANQYCSSAFIIISALTCLVQVILYSLMGGGEGPVLWSSGFLVVGLTAVIPLTEIHLKKNGFT